MKKILSIPRNTLTLAGLLFLSTDTALVEDKYLSIKPEGAQTHETEPREDRIKKIQAENRTSGVVDPVSGGLNWVDHQVMRAIGTDLGLALFPERKLNSLKRQTQEAWRRYLDSSGKKESASLFKRIMLNEETGLRPLPENSALNLNSFEVQMVQQMSDDELITYYFEVWLPLMSDDDYRYYDTDDDR